VTKSRDPFDRLTPEKGGGSLGNNIHASRYHQVGARAFVPARNQTLNLLYNSGFVKRKVPKNQDLRTVFNHQTPFNSSVSDSEIDEKMCAMVVMDISSRSGEWKFKRRAGNICCRHLSRLPNVHKCQRPWL
jgi:hypothetical protein